VLTVAFAASGEAGLGVAATTCSADIRSFPKAVVAYEKSREEQHYRGHLPATRATGTFHTKLLVEPNRKNAGCGQRRLSARYSTRP